jgi:glycerophosphoryl diester phosphodiesterase
VIDLVGDRARLVVELKRGDEPPGATALAVARLLTASPLRDVVVSSFDPAALMVLRARAPWIDTALLTADDVPVARCLGEALRVGAREAHPSAGQLLGRLDLVPKAHFLGLELTAWTVDDQAELRRLAHAAVDGAIVDRPANALAALALSTSVT